MAGRVAQHLDQRAELERSAEAASLQQQLHQELLEEVVCARQEVLDQRAEVLFADGSLILLEPVLERNDQLAGAEVLVFRDQDGEGHQVVDLEVALPLLEELLGLGPQRLVQHALLVEESHLVQAEPERLLVEAVVNLLVIFYGIGEPEKTAEHN